MNKIFKYLIVVLIGIIVSLYLFPIELWILPGINSKMILAGIGLLVIIASFVARKDNDINKDILDIILLSGLVSLIGFISVVYNDTSDFSYATYFISMLVWLSAAYLVLQIIKKLHNYLSVVLISNYLIGVCVVQCISALLIDFFLPIKFFVNSYVGRFGGMGSAEYMDGIDRLYGIGAALDIAGTRFAAILIILSVLIYEFSWKKSNMVYVYILAFLLISVIGNMISRTTTVGIIFSIFYWLCVSIKSMSLKDYKFWFRLISVLLIISPLVLYIYNNELFYEKFRFGFEGFFSLIEDGVWDVSSNNKLETMYRFPDSLKTWIIGDGYFNNPSNDLNYLGHLWKGFYMGTDVGYLRFIYYFGIVGLIFFTVFFIRVCQACVNKQTSYKLLFIMLLFCNLVIWLKVSTDLFVVFALFLCIENEQNFKKISSAII